MSENSEDDPLSRENPMEKRCVDVDPPPLPQVIWKSVWVVIVVEVNDFITT